MSTRFSSTIKIVQGTRGTGKTNALKSLLKETFPLFIIDIRDEYGHIPVITKFNDFLILLYRGKLSTDKLQVRFALSSQQDYLKLFYFLNQLKDCTIVVDEADALFSDRQFSKALTNVFLGSRNNNITMWFVGKRPFLIPILVRSQADEFYIFGTKEKKDIQYLEDRLQNVDFPKDPRSLDKFECIHFIDGQKPKLEKFQKFWEKEQ